MSAGTWVWPLRGLLVGLAVAGLNHWMTMAAMRRTNPKDPFANTGAIVGSYIVRLFTSAAAIIYFRDHPVAILTSLAALTVPHKVIFFYNTFVQERREGRK